MKSHQSAWPDYEQLGPSCSHSHDSFSQRWWEMGIDEFELLEVRGVVAQLTKFLPIY